MKNESKNKEESFQVFSLRIYLHNHLFAIVWFRIERL